MILIALELRSVDLSVSSCFTSRSDNFGEIVSHTWPEVKISFPFEICAFAVSKLTREFVNKKVSNTNRKTSKAAMLCPLYSLKISIYKGKNWSQVTLEYRKCKIREAFTWKVLVKIQFF